MQIHLLSLRRQLGLTQRRMAETIGITPNYLAQLERGERKPSKPLVVIFEALDAGWLPPSLTGDQPT